MSYRMDKQVLTAHKDGRTHRQTDAGNDNTQRPKLASGNKIVDLSNVFGASPVGAALTTSSFSTYNLASMDKAKTAARWEMKHSILNIMRLTLNVWRYVACFANC